MPAAHAHAASPVVRAPGSAKEELALLLTQYRTLLGDRMDRFPVLKWRDELMVLEEEFSRTLPDRKRDGQMRDALSPDLRKEFFHLRDLHALASMTDYKGDEMELLLALVPEMTAEHSASPEAVGGCLSKMREKIDQNASLLAELSQTTKLPAALVKRAQIDGPMEMRKSILEAALRKIEPPQAEPRGYQIQVLTYHMKPRKPSEEEAKRLLDDVIQENARETLQNMR
jgi:hypothetical protein